MLKKSRFLHSIENLNKLAHKKDLSLAEILTQLGEQSHLAMICLLSLPFLQPIPMPGLSAVLGFVICFISYFRYRHCPPWLPKRYGQKKISAESLVKITEVADRLWLRIEKLVHPRWPIFHKGSMALNFNILLIVINAVLLSLPLPIPFSNLIPALSIFLNAFGQLEEDGVLVMMSYFLCLISFAFFIALAFGVQAGLSYF